MAIGIPILKLAQRLYSGIVVREFTIAIRQKSEVLQPLLFLLMVVTLFPIGISPSPELLQRIGPGAIWIAAILSTLLSLDRIFRDDFYDGSLEQLMLSGIPIVFICLCKVLCHWVITFGPLLLMMPFFALLLNLTFDMTVALLATLLIGTPILSLLGAIGVALTMGLRKNALILALILVPVFIPLLIFSTSAIDSAASQLPYLPQLAIIGALLLISLAFAPVAIAYALRVSQH